MSKVIFHIDMNCFFASCEIAEDKSLKGKKMAVAHNSLDKKGMVLTASYEAKRLGVKTTMPVFEALKVCPDLIIVSPHYELYEDYSRRFFEYFYTITKNVEPASIDEAYLDVTGLCKPNEYLDFAKKIQDYLYNNLQLPCSIGIGPNKLLAKMGSDLKKPLGITIVRKKDVPSLLWPLPIEDLYMCGKKTSQALRYIGINTIGELANYKDKSILIKMMGNKSVDYLLQSANGEGSDVVDPTAWDSISSISHAHTLDHNEFVYSNVLKEVENLASLVSERLQKMNVLAKTLSLTLKYDNFKSFCKSVTLNKPTNKLDEMIHQYTILLLDLYNVDNGVRLISCGASKFSAIKEGATQLSIFDSFDKEEKDYQIDKIISNINKTVGSNTLTKGITKKK